MSTRTLSYIFSGAGTARAPGGRFFFVKSASAPVTIKAISNNTAQTTDFNDVGAGLKFGPVSADLAWRYLDITSAVAQTVTIVLSDDGEVDIASTVNVAGSVQVMETPSSGITTPPRIAMNTATDTQIVPAVGSWRRVTIQNPPSNTDSVNIGTTGELATNRGYELEPGAAVTVITSAAIHGRAVTNTPSVQTFVES